ncbi:hypothetical protein H6P81_003839 [Aristolochia fimbriata]|uniref:Glycosyl transferase family 1 domain-containing protein n=1 Tax=Aristolochia fimbriata TaxID=158543 RepID=A0AAV7FH58_ARIFI|nr:hypothetical protein H6P81_003839 [Aristolochia fimbriata]
MEENNNRGDMQGNVLRLSSLRPSGSMKSSLSGRSSPRGSPSFRRLHSSKTPRREGRSKTSALLSIRESRLIFWLILITLWTYLGFYIQSRWAHANDTAKGGFIGYQSKIGYSDIGEEQNLSVGNHTGFGAQNSSHDKSLLVGSHKDKVLKRLDAGLAHKQNRVSSRRNASSKRSKRGKTARNLRANVPIKQSAAVEIQSEDEVEEIPRTNTSYGLIVGPFDKTEDSILDWSPAKRTGTCNRKGDFARLVWSRKFLLVLHELSMTGAPLSMMELATELMSCGATVSAVVLSRKGGLMGELTRRGIKVLPDKAEFSYKTAMKADLVIAGSAVCESWIEQYLSRFPVGFNQIAWWIMENRREYFDRAKHMLNRVKMLIFLSESQLKQWLLWCEEEHIKLKLHPQIVPLSVNDELAFVAGIPCSLNTPSFSVEKMLEKKKLLRDAVRKDMGITDNDVLVMSLSSINPGKGQLLFLESARMAVQGFTGDGNSYGVTSDFEQSMGDYNQISRALLQEVKDTGKMTDGQKAKKGSRAVKKKKKSSLHRIHSSVSSSNSTILTKKLLSNNKSIQGQTLKILIGSLGSKSNKVPYVKGILQFLSQHLELSKLVLWTPATTRVASLYAAADIYVINAQGLGETFGRVTIEAMAFGLPILGTDAGGTQELVDNNITGLLHPVGRPGLPVLAQNFQYLLSNQSARHAMGMKGKKKVEKLFLKNHMYQKLAKVFVMCMKIK